MQGVKAYCVRLMSVLALGLLRACAMAQVVPHIPYSWRNVAIGGGGYVLDVVCSPLKRDLVYLRTDVGGFYRWNSKRSTWVPLNDGFTSQQSNFYGGEALAVDPFRADTVYVAAGKDLWSSTLGAIFKSTDEGRHWQQLPLHLPMGGNADDRWAGSRLALSPFHRGVILFGSRESGLWRSVDGGRKWNLVSTLNTHGIANIGFNSVVFSAKSPSEVYASVPGYGVCVSQNDGATWKVMPKSPIHVERMAASPTGAVYASATDGVYVLRHGEWSDITPPGRQRRFCGISISPRHPHEVLAATQSSHLRLFKTHDGGRSWSLVPFSVKSTVPWYAQSMLQLRQVAGLAIDPFTPGKVWLTDWYAVYSCDDDRLRPAVFENHENGHEEVVVFSLAAPPNGPPLLSGVADVDGFRHSSLTRFPNHGYGDWYHGHGPTYGDTDQITWCAGSPQNLARVGVRKWNDTGGGASSSDGGRTWNSFTGLNPAAMPERIAISAKDPKCMALLTLHQGPGYATTDGGKTWQKMKGLPLHIVPSVWYWKIPLAADGERSHVFYLCFKGTLYRSTDGGVTWKVRSKAVPYGVTALVTTPGVADDIWIAAADRGLWHSNNGGRTWQPVGSVKAASLFAEGIGAHGRGLALYLYGSLEGGQQGIFISTDLGQTWNEIDADSQPVGDVPECMAGSWSRFGQVFIGTNGRGVFVGDAK